ncbi:oligopeptide/dipeptide ABC transporter ATP-binding protein [Reyranella sp.]|uniref:oligopeptide/dipeptide ABC transporter ATP-binding protein n=1 Tax=Reyranella sp. TaxID=1929291 RepID=UPI003D0FB09C
MSDAAFLRADAVTKAFKVQRKSEGLLQSLKGGQTTSLRAVDDVSLDIARGEVFAIVGESGSGKTTLANLLARVTVPTEGRIMLDGEEISRGKDIDLRSLRRRIQIVFQDPGSSLNPRQTVGEIVALPLKLAGMRGHRDRSKRIAELLEAVHLPADFASRYPVSLSGGQKQRVNVARALALEPNVLVLDEPTSALDVSVQARILALLMTLRKERHLTYVLVTHNFGVVRAIADRVAVMYFGKIVEIGTVDQLMADPRHPYTRTLLSAIPVVRESERALIPSVEARDGELPSFIDPPRHCSFYSRCAARQPQCLERAHPALATLADGRKVSCHVSAPVAS